MKALHVVHRVCHYIALWLFVLVGAIVLLSAVYAVIGQVGGYSALVAAEDAGEAFELGDYAYVLAATSASAAGLVGLALPVFAVAVVHLVASILFRQLRDLVKHNKEKKCHCGCECDCEAKSDLDAQVEEVLKWKNLYVEGVITEREFIDKRNEILRISK